MFCCDWFSVYWFILNLISLQLKSKGLATLCLAWQLNASSQRTLTKPHHRPSPTSVSRSTSNSVASIAYYCQVYGEKRAIIGLFCSSLSDWISPLLFCLYNHFYISQKRMNFSKVKIQIWSQIPLFRRLPRPLLMASCIFDVCEFYFLWCLSV